MDNVEKMRKYMEVILHRKTATYRHGKLDFSKGEGGNHHIFMYDENGNEIGYIWFDTHVGTGWPTKPNQVLGFCGTGNPSCNGTFRNIATSMFPKKWEESSSLLDFTVDMFVQYWEMVLNRIR
ncbi:MAG: hypothetical protein NC489_16520 [Ruminococcus flavefaciens]|nr:hypothetical protein [Ruminococcus flavefaciens]